MKNKIRHFAILGLFIFVGSSIYGQWMVDRVYGFKINVPSTWSQNSSIDGTDKVYDLYSPDENAAIQIRAFEATSQFTVDLLVQVYEESMLPQGSTRESLTYHVSKQGIPGKQGIYTYYYNGTHISMGVFFALQNGMGYVISAIIPTSLLQQKTVQVKRVTESFTLLNNSYSSGGTMNSSFKITKIQLCDRLDQYNNAANHKRIFNTQTPEIHAAINFTGYTGNDLTVSWVYTNWNRTITRDKYNFTDGYGGVGVVSLSKPHNGWPIGDYKVIFEMDGKEIDSRTFEIQ